MAASRSWWPSPTSPRAPRVAEHPDLLLQQAVDLGRLVRPHPGGGQLDGQRQAVEVGDERPHRVVVGRGVEVLAHGGRPLDEQGDGVLVGQGGQVEEVLVGDPEPLPAGDEHRGLRAAVPQRGGHRGGIGQDVVAAVEHHEGPSLAERADHRVERRAAVGDRGAEQVGEPAGHPVDAGRPGRQRGQRAEPHPAGPVVAVVAGELHGEAALAAPGRARDRDRAVGPHELVEAPALHGSSQQATRRGGHAPAGVVLGAQRREAGGEVGGEDLVDVLGLHEVAQPVLAEVEERDVGGEVVGHQVRSGAAHHDLAAVGDVVEASRAVHGGPEPVAVALLGLAAVEPHPHPERADAPVARGEGPLGGHRGGHAGAGLLEHGGHAVAAELEDGAVVVGDHLRQQLVVLGQVVAHGGGRALPEPRAALDVREQERPGGVHRRLPHGPSLARRGSGWRRLRQRASPRR